LNIMDINVFYSILNAFHIYDKTYGNAAKTGTWLSSIVIPWGWGQASRFYCSNGDSKSKKLTYENGRTVTVTVTHRIW